MAGTTQPIASNVHRADAEPPVFRHFELLDRPRRRSREIEPLIHRALGRAVIKPCISDTVLAARSIAKGQMIAEFTHQVLGHREDGASDFVDVLRTQGVAIDKIYLDLLQPTARRLGELWEDDICDFVAVTLGLLRLHNIVRELTPLFHDLVHQRGEGHRALLTPLPGDQHSFGILLVAEFFRRAGWSVRSGPVRSLDELAETIGAQWYSVIGFSISSLNELDALSAVVKLIKRESRNRGVGILVGGSVFIDHPDLVASIGAHATAIDASGAVERGNQFCHDETS